MLNETGRYAEVPPFKPDCESFHKVPIVDDVIEYDDKCSEKTCLLVFCETFLVPKWVMI